MVFMASKMERIRIIINKEYAEEVVSALHDIGALQIETLPGKAMALLKQGESVDLKRIGDFAQRFRGLENILYAMPSSERFSFDSIEDLMERAGEVKIDERVARIKKDMDALAASIKATKYDLNLLGRIGDFTEDMSILSSKNIESYVAYGKELKTLEAAARKEFNGAIVTTLKNAIIVSFRKGEEKRFAAIAERFKVSLEIVPQMSGTAQETRKALGERLDDLESMRSGLDEELVNISAGYYPIVSAISEQLNIELAKLEVSTRMGVTEATVAIEGWMQKKDVKGFETLLKKITEDHYVLHKIKTHDHPPTLMSNPVGFRLYEFFVRFYSIPQSGEVDPTVIFAIAFPIFFGFMVGDVGYGSVMLALSLWLLWRLNHMPKKSRIPKPIANFITMIVSTNSLKVLAKAIIPGAIISIILGVLFNAYFGFQLPFYKAPFDPVSNLSTLLVIAGWIGVTMVSVGFFIGFINKLIEGEKKHALAKLGWLFAAWGFVLMGLNVLHRADMGLDNIMAAISYAALVAGILMVLVFEGVRAIMELPSLISHILSYTRLVGILLASAILASVINFVFIGSTHHGLLVILGIVILILGQLFNLVIAMFEPGIQGARLIYVEFFSKFFTGNGRQFRPFSNNRRHTLAKFKLE